MKTKGSFNNASQQAQRFNNKNNSNMEWKNNKRGIGDNFGKNCSYCNKKNLTTDE